MKILQIINALEAGGAEKLLVDLSRRFRDLGHEIDLMVLDGAPTPLGERFKRDVGSLIVSRSKRMFSYSHVKNIASKLPNNVPEAIGRFVLESVATQEMTISNGPVPFVEADPKA